MNAHVSSGLLPEANQQELSVALLASLKARFGAALSTASAVREQHGRDESRFAVPPPGAVVFAESTQDVG